MAQALDVELEERFSKASEFAKSCIGSLSQEKILNLYGLYKQATEGTNTSAKPNFWNATAKKKWEAWTAHSEKTQEQAMSAYIDAVSDINPNWQEEATPSWVVHSVMQNNESEKADSEKNIFDFVKENRVDLLEKALSTEFDVDSVDDEGLGLCHWAADRGYESIMKVLLESGADANIRDAEKQTPLHYAASCGHIGVATILVNHGADPTLRDADGQKPCDVADSPEIIQLLQIV